MNTEIKKVSRYFLNAVLAATLLLSCTNSDPFYQNYDAECVIGKRYTIYGVKSDNPFEPQAVATVIITDKMNGYVQYCWDYDYKKPDKVTFSRSCKEFIESTLR